jgi:hypothetical protein
MTGGAWRSATCIVIRVLGALGEHQAEDCGLILD